MFFANLSTACVAETKGAESEPPTNAEFLELTEDQRHWYFFGAFHAVGHTVHMQDKAQGRCVWEWYFDDLNVKIEKLLKSMQLYPDHSPTSIMIAHLERDCGKLPKASPNLR